MSLPTLNVPTDTVKLYSQPKPTTVRPYLVGEEKILLMAQAALEQDPKSKEVEKAVRDIINRCTFGAVGMDTLPVFDVTYLFLKLRAMSLNNVIESNFRCKAQVPVPVPPSQGEQTGDCNTLVKINIDINDIKLTVPPGHTNKVMLSKDLGVQLKYPTATVYEEAQKASDLSDVIKACLDKVYTPSGEVWEITQESAKDVQDFIDQISLQNITDIRDKFFDTMPRLEYTFTFKCPKCGWTEDVTLRELEDFFD